MIRQPLLTALLQTSGRKSEQVLQLVREVPSNGRRTNKLHAAAWLESAGPRDRMPAACTQATSFIKHFATEGERLCSIIGCTLKAAKSRAL